MSGLNLSGQNGSKVTLEDATIDGFQGDILTPDSPEYEETRTIWNATATRRPGMIARCTGAADVIAAVKFAGQHGVLTSVRGGGHNIAGSALNDGGLMIDLSLMRGVICDPAGKRVRVQGGALLGDVDHETQVFGLAVPFGINSTTGVAGLTLGAGYGWLSRAYGHSVDNLVAADIVTADGAFRQISEQQEPDLFWAIRGGGGNFGVVTSFEFRCHPVGPLVLAGPVIHLLTDAKAVLDEYREIVNSLPDQVTCWCVLRKAPPFPFVEEKYHGKPILALAMCHAGDPNQAEKDLAPLRAIGTPIADAVGPVPYEAWQSAFDPVMTPGSRNYWKSQDFTALTDELRDILIGSIDSLPSDSCEVFLGHMGGAAGRVPSDAIAFPHRSQLFILNIHGRWEDESEDEKCIGWVRDLFAKTDAMSTGGVYVNFMPEQERDRRVGPYGANQPQLERIKAKYDPANMFRTNINITPASIPTARAG